MFLVLLLK